MAIARSLSILDRLLFGFVLLLFLTLAVTTDALRRLDLVLYDSLLRLVPVELSPDIAIVAIDEPSLAELGQWPWPRDLHTQLVQRLRDAGARALVFDVLFTEPDRYRPERDAALALAMQQFGSVVLPLHMDQLDSGAPLTEILPQPLFTAVAAQLGHAHVELDQDGIARGLYLYQGVGRAAWPSLSLATLRQVIPHKAAAFVGETEPQPNSWLKVGQQFYMIPFAGSAGTVPTYSYSEVLAGRLPAEILQGKTLFIGATAAGMGDLLPTPYSGSHSPMPGVEVHANAFNGLLHDNLIQPVPPAVTLVFSALLTLLPILLFPRLAPERNLPLTLILAVASVALSFGLLAVMDLWMGPAPLLATLLLAYPLWSWRRLARLNRFLEQELRRLSQEPKLIPAPSDSAWQDWYRHLVALLEPSEHALYENNRLLAGTPLAAGPNESPATDRWTLENGYWSYRSAAAPHYLAVLRWNDAAPIEIAHILSRLVPPLPQRSGRRHDRRAERIERRIQQVRAAISSLRTMRQFIGDSFENMPDGILVTDQLGQVLFANGHSLAWFQHEKASAPRSLLDWLVPYPAMGSASWPKLVRQVLLQGQETTAELRIGSRELLVQLVPFAANDSHESGLIASFSDITRVREEQRRRLETVDFVSHDLRSPLVSQLALLEQLIDSEMPEKRDLLQRARAYTQKSLQLADQFLQLTRVEAADELPRYECDLLAILENAVDQIQDQAAVKNMEVVIEDSSEEAWLLGNAELLERVVVNLLTNAIKYSPQNTCISTCVGVTDDHLVLTVADQGLGMDADTAATMFERFRQAPKLDGHRVASAGLGLRFVKTVMERHQGEIQVQSAAGQGTCIRLLLPRP